MKRRRFLRYLGIGAVTAPVIAKTVGERELPKLIPPNKYNSSLVCVSGNESWQYEIGMLLSHRFEKSSTHMIVGELNDARIYSIKDILTGKVIEVTEPTLLNYYIIIGQQGKVWAD